MHPRALRIVANLFIVSGVVALIGVAADLLLHSRFNFDLSVLNLWIGRWLLAREPKGRRWALVVIHLNLFLLPVAACFMLLSPSAPEFRVAGVPVGSVSPIFAVAFAAAIFALQVWEYRVLNRPDIRALFPETPGEFAAPRALV